MKTTAKKRRKLLPAIAMLTVSAIMLSTATYAWFTMNKDATVSNIQMTATTPSSIEISLGHISGGDGETKSITNPEENDWYNEIDFSTVYDKVGQISPASTTTGNADSFFAATDAVTNGTATKYMDANVQSVKQIKGNTTTTTQGYYLEFPIWMRTRGIKDANITLSENSTVKLLTEGDANDITQAVRLAFVDQSGTGPITASKPTIWNPNSGTYFTGGAVESFASSTATYKEVTDLIQTTTYNEDGTVKANGTELFTLTKGTEDAPGTAVKFIVRIWIEGQDQTCVNKNAGSKFVGNLNFLNVAED